jgi:hypothetical protein
MLLFITLGLSLAVALAVIDDRLYRRVDLDQLGIPVLAVIPPATLHKGKAKAKARAAAARKRKPSEPKKRASTGAPQAGTGGPS